MTGVGPDRDRGRLTIPDVVVVVVVLFFAAALFPVYQSGLLGLQNASTGVRLLAGMLPAMVVLVTFWVVARRALGVGA